MPKGYPRTDIENRGRPLALTADDTDRIMEALREQEGFLGRTASALNVSYPTLRKFINNSPELKEFHETLVQENVDEVHKNVLDRIRDRDNGSHILAIFYLKSQGGWKDTNHIIQENHNFNWREALIEDTDTVESHFVESDEIPDSGWK